MDSLWTKKHSRYDFYCVRSVASRHDLHSCLRLHSVAMGVDPLVLPQQPLLLFEVSLLVAGLVLDWDEVFLVLGFVLGVRS